MKKAVDIDKMLLSQTFLCALFTASQIPATMADALRAMVEAVAADEHMGIIVRPEGSDVLRVVLSQDAEAGTWDAMIGELKGFGARNGFSYAIYPGVAAPHEFRLAVFDMDSTLIDQEVIDELAAFAGLKEHVSKITEAAMRGELDFHAALRERVALLAGQPESILEEVLKRRISATAGLEELLSGLGKLRIRTAIVSGGFLPIVEPFGRTMGFDHVKANALEIEDGKLTGRVLGEIVDANVKREELLRLCRHYGCELREAIAVGDGANDLPMIREAGLGVAFCAKPIVREGALSAVVTRRLDVILKLI